MEKDYFLFCPTADCPAIYEIADDNFQEFECLLCHKQYCLICRQKAHGDEDCYKQEELASLAVMN